MSSYVMKLVPQNDMESILMALNSGINLVTTIHGFGIEDLYKRLVFKDIVENYVFITCSST